MEGSQRFFGRKESRTEVNKVGGYKSGVGPLAATATGEAGQGGAGQGGVGSPPTERWAAQRSGAAVGRRDRFDLSLL